jgi:hypothetical protein
MLLVIDDVLWMPSMALFHYCQNDYVCHSTMLKRNQNKILNLFIFVVQTSKSHILVLKMMQLN